MPRHKFSIKTPEDRASLPPKKGNEPYWEYLSKGVYLGFRPTVHGQGTWVLRLQDGKTKKYHKLGGAAELGYPEAAAAAYEKSQTSPTGEVRRLTVGEAWHLYQDNQFIEKGPVEAQDIARRFRRMVEGDPVARLHLDELKPGDITDWRNRIAKGRSPNTVNRDFRIMKAALNHVYRQDPQNIDDRGWKTAGALKGVPAAERKALSLEERQSLLKVAPDHMRAVILGLLYTGARPGTAGLLGARVKSFNGKRFTLVTRKGSADPRRYSCQLSPEAARFFTEQARGKLPNAPLFPAPDGGEWNSSTWNRHWKEVAMIARLPPNTVAYQLRHTAISQWLENGIPPHTVSKWTGTSMAQIDKHYGHLIHDIADERLAAIQMI